MGKTKKILLIDGQHLAYRAIYRFKSSQHNGVKSGLAYGLPFMLESYVRRFRANEVHIAFDSGKSPYRLGLLPNYKNREKKLDFDHKSFDTQLGDLVEVLQNMGCMVYRGGSLEADDTLYRILRKTKGKVYITLVSGDKDFVQTLVPKYKTKAVITIFNPNKDKIITPQNSLEHYGYTPEENVDWLVLDGDKSDKIPGVYGYGKVKIRKFLDEHGSIANYLEQWSDEAVEKAYKLNKPLIDLHTYYQNYGKDEPIGRLNGTAVYDHDKVKAFAKKYGLKVILKEQFRSTMEGLTYE